MDAPIAYGDGIYAVDADYVRPGLAAVHLIVERGHAAIVDTGANNAVPRVLDALKSLGVGAEAVDFVIVTHVHLDHAGAAGTLLAACPNARLVVHPNGARHMIDPSKLVEGTRAVYGSELFATLYGKIVPCPASRVIEAPDGAEFELAGRPLRCIDAPGHARHHFVLHDPRSAGVFTGDAFGISYREFDVDGRAFAFPTTTPVQFDPEAAHTTLERIVSLGPEQAFLTHFGRIRDVPRIAASLHTQLDAFVAMARQSKDHASLSAAMRAYLVERLREHGGGLTQADIEGLLAGDIELNTQGLRVWREREAGMA